MTFAYRPGLNHDLKHQASSAFTIARSSGVVVAPDRCSECSKVGPVDGHHDDYAKPLEVRWLCRSCHVRDHAQNTARPVVVRRPSIETRNVAMRLPSDLVDRMEATRRHGESLTTITWRIIEAGLAAEGAK